MIILINLAVNCLNWLIISMICETGVTKAKTENIIFKIFNHIRAFIKYLQQWVSNCLPPFITADECSLQILSNDLWMTLINMLDNV